MTGRALGAIPFFEHERHQSLKFGMRLQPTVIASKLEVMPVGGEEIDRLY